MAGGTGYITPSGATPWNLLLSISICAFSGLVELHLVRTGGLRHQQQTHRHRLAVRLIEHISFIHIWLDLDRHGDMGVAGVHLSAVWFPASLFHMSLCPWARHLTPNWSWWLCYWCENVCEWLVWLPHRLAPCIPPPPISVWMWLQCKVLWVVKGLEQCFINADTTERHSWASSQWCKHI